MIALPVLLCALLAAAPAPSTTAPPPPSKARLFVMRLAPAGGLDAATANAMTEAVTAEIGARNVFDVLSARDVETIMGAERQRQLSGCSDDAASCLAELGDALGARLVVSGSLARLGTAYQLSLQTLDTVRAAPIGRSTRISTDLALLQAQLPYAIAEALALPLPPPPSRVLPYSLMGGGGLVFIGGGLVLFHSLTREFDLTATLDRGSEGLERLSSVTAYQEELQSIGAERATGLVVMAGGVALGVAGFLLNPRDPGQAARVAVVPSLNGFTVAGVLP